MRISPWPNSPDDNSYKGLLSYFIHEVNFFRQMIWRYFILAHLWSWKISSVDFSGGGDGEIIAVHLKTALGFIIRDKISHQFFPSWHYMWNSMFWYLSWSNFCPNNLYLSTVFLLIFLIILFHFA